MREPTVRCAIDSTGEQLELTIGRRWDCCEVRSQLLDEAIGCGHEPWLDAVRAHLVMMRDLTTRLVHERLPGVNMVAPEATFLAWLDCSATPFGVDPFRAFAGAGIAVNAGTDLGPGGAGFVRLNFATSPAVLEQVVDTMARAVAG